MVRSLKKQGKSFIVEVHVMGLLVSCIRFMAMIYVSESFSLFLEALSITMPMALIGVLYGLTGYLLLIPVQMKLESMC